MIAMDELREIARSLHPARLTGLDNLPPHVNETRIYEARIVIQLHAGQAIYSDRLGCLYFFDSTDRPISRIIETVMRGLGRTPDIRPVLIDEHRFIAVGKKVLLDEETLVAVSAALTLAGVNITQGGADIVRRAGY